MAEGAPLLREYGLIAHRGFESLSLRHHVVKYLNCLQAVLCATFPVFSGPIPSDELSRDKYLISFFNLVCCNSDLVCLA